MLGFPIGFLLLRRFRTGAVFTRFLDMSVFHSLKVARDHLQ